MGLDRHDVNILQDLARRVADIAARPEQARKADQWRRHNGLQSDRPMVLVFPEGSWRELLPPESLTCRDPWARQYEADLRRRVYYHEFLRDDNVIDATVVSPLVIRSTGWGVGIDRVRPEEAHGAAHYNPVIVDEADADALQRPIPSVDRAESERRFQMAADVFGTILPVEMRGRTHAGFAIIDLFSQLRGFQQLFLDMCDRPEWLHRVLQFMTDAVVQERRELEAMGALSLNNGAHYCGSGGVGFSDELPQPDFNGTVRCIDQWGFATTQIFSDVSPAMHETFALRYERQWLRLFGLNAYGCCEPLHLKMDAVRTIPRLRRVSMSPWVDMKTAAEAVGRDVIFSRKPNPAIVAGPTWEPDAVRTSVRADLECTRGCVVELVLKDTHTCAHDPRRMHEWVRIAREEACRFAGA